MGNKMGEKSRQAAKIDKAKDLIDEAIQAGGAVPGGSDEENDPSKIVSLFVMGEYEDLNDLVRDGSKKLRECKKLTDEQVLMYNRPRSGGASAGSVLSLRSSNNASTVPSSPGGASSAHSYSHASYDVAMAGTGAPSNHRKRGHPRESRSSSRHGSGARSSSRGAGSRASPPAPRLKSNPRDTRPVNAAATASRYGRMDSGKSVASQSTAKIQAVSPPCGMGRSECGALSRHSGGRRGAQQDPRASPDYPSGARCNFFPPATDWSKGIAGFGMNFFNCGNEMSPQPTMNAPSSPRYDGAGGAGAGGSPRDVTGGGMYGHHHSHHPHHAVSPHQSAGAG